MASVSMNVVAPACCHADCTQSAVSRGAAALHPSTVLGYTCGLAPLPPPPSPTLMTRLLSLAGGAVASPRSITTEVCGDGA